MSTTTMFCDDVSLENVVASGNDGVGGAATLRDNDEEMDLLIARMLDDGAPVWEGSD